MVVEKLVLEEEEAMEEVPNCCPISWSHGSSTRAER